MARQVEGEAAGIYAAAEQWANAALRSDGSLFTPGRTIWSPSVIDDFIERLVDEPDRGTFWEKLERQLRKASLETIQLAAEILYVHYLIGSPGAIRGSKKRARISQVLGWADSRIAIPEGLNRALDGGVVNPGVAFAAKPHRQLQLIAELAQQCKPLTAEQRKQVLTDSWEFKDLFSSIEVPGAKPQEAALLHLVHPDTFEPIVSQKHKRSIADTFAHLLDRPSGDDDRDLLAIRPRLTDTYGQNFHYYLDQLPGLWGFHMSKWDQFIWWSRRFAEHPDFDKQERDFKLEVAGNLQQARSALESGSDGWLTALRRAFGSPNNLTAWQMHDGFLKWCEGHPSEAESALRSLWNSQDGIEEAVSEFLERIPDDALRGKGTRVSLASFLATAIDPYKYPVYRITVFDDGYRLSGHPQPDAGADEAKTYRHALSFLDTLVKEASPRGLELRDRLDAQSVLWSVVRSGVYEDVLPEVEHAIFVRYRQGDTPPLPPPPAPPAPEPETLDEVADRLLWNGEHLRTIQRLLEDKLQVVFYGPPGTGKTYVALELAQHFAGDDGSTDLVQFHPSYAYEDFIEGYRPADPGDGPAFKLKDGPLKRIAQRARDEPDTRHVLVIDEINRGNVARVFGELYFLLEYRDREMSLQYSGGGFSLPENLWFIATMNTADRSIALVDTALRRRFHFVPFFPDEPPVQGLLRRWLGTHKPGLLWVAGVVDRANTKLADRHMAIGPSHFMHKKLNEEWVKLIWEHSILPYVEEQLFGETERLKEFDLGKLRAEVESSDSGADGDGDAASEPS